jgi:hypothetical protein
MGIGAILIIVGIVIALVQNLLLGLLIILIGLAFGGVRRGRWY